MNNSSVIKLAKRIFPNVTWSLPQGEKTIYLTFDDGPIPEVTPFVLETLKKYNAAATFFCIGDNVKKHPEIYRMIDTNVHSIGNHTMHHMNGWLVTNSAYFEDVKKAQSYLTTKLFRPPYGKIRPSQVYRLKKEFRIIMWDVLSKDYDRELTGADCLRRVLQQTRLGSIIVFHDSLKAESRMRYALPFVLKHFSELGYSFKRIDGNF